VEILHELGGVGVEQGRGGLGAGEAAEQSREAERELEADVLFEVGAQVGAVQAVVDHEVGAGQAVGHCPLVLLRHDQLQHMGFGKMKKNV